MTEPSRRGEIAPFYVMEVMKAAAERERVGGDVLHLEVGQPSTSAPSSVLAAAAAALGSNRLGYTDATGIPELRRRIAEHYGERYGVAVDPGRVVVTMGASGGFVLAFLAAFDAGQRVAVTEPGYPCYRNTLDAFGVEVVPIPVGPATRFVPTGELLDAAGPLDGLMIASPANPTGTALRAEELADVAGFCRENDVRLIADEIYHGIEYGEQVPTALSADPGRGSAAEFLQVLLDDRVEVGMDGGPRGAGTAHRAACAESVHLGADSLPVGGAGCVRCHRRARCECGSLCGQ